jgi:hypothetical protein
LLPINKDRNRRHNMPGVFGLSKWSIIFEIAR